jgi:hypothetical protein
MDVLKTSTDSTPHTLAPFTILRIGIVLAEVCCESSDSQQALDKFAEESPEGNMHRWVIRCASRCPHSRDHYHHQFTHGAFTGG